MDRLNYVLCRCSSWLYLMHIQQNFVVYVLYKLIFVARVCFIVTRVHFKYFDVLSAYQLTYVRTKFFVSERFLIKNLFCILCLCPRCSWCPSLCILSSECLCLRLGVSISWMLCLHAACSQPAIGHQPSQPSCSAVWDRAMAGLLLFVDSFINRCYLLVSGSVRVRRGAVGRLVLGLGLGLALGLQLGIGIGFRRNHSWSSTFTPSVTIASAFKNRLDSCEEWGDWKRKLLQPDTIK